MMILLLSRPSGCAGIVDGEDSKQRVEKQAAHGEPHVGSRMFDWLWSAGIGASDDAALGQSSGTARRAVEATSAASFRLRLGLLVRYEITRTSSCVSLHRAVRYSMILICR